MLPGFTYPVFTCICPQTKWTFDVRCLTVSEEDKILQSSTFGYQLLHNINDVIWSCIVNKPDEIKTFNDFRDKITQKDRDALLYSLLQASDADKQDLEVTCINCQAKNNISVNLSECFSANVYPGEPGEILNKVESLVIEHRDITLEFDIIVPTLTKERLVMTYLGNRQVAPTLLILLSILKEIRVIKDNSVVEKANTLADLEVAIRNLPAKMTKRIRQRYMDVFGQYTMDLNYKYICSQCGADNLHTINLVEVLFRTLSE